MTATVTETVNPTVETTNVTMMTETMIESTVVSTTANMTRSTTKSTTTIGDAVEATVTAVTETISMWSTLVSLIATVTVTVIERGDADTSVMTMMSMSPGHETWTTIIITDLTERHDDVLQKAFWSKIAAFPCLSVQALLCVRVVMSMFRAIRC